MTADLHRIGTLRATLVVLVTAAVAFLALTHSGLSVSGGDHAVATVKPPVPRSAVVTAAAQSSTVRSVARRRRHTPVSVRRKQCPPVDGVEFTVSVGQTCPKRLKGTTRTHLSPRLRHAASQRRIPAVVPPATDNPHGRSDTAQRGETPTTTAEGGVAAPPAANEAKRPSGAVGSAPGSPSRSKRRKPDPAPASDRPPH